MKNQIHKDVIKHRLFGAHYFISLHYKVDTPLSQGSIIDIETTGLDPSTDNIITLGIIKKKHLLLYQLVHEDSYKRFWSLCNRLAKAQPTPRYGYACHFEADFLRIKDDKWTDLTQYFEIDYNDFIPFRRYTLADVTHHPFRDEPIDISGSEIPGEWQQYVTSRNKIHLTNIIYHCYCDMLRTKQLTEKDINTSH